MVPSFTAEQQLGRMLPSGNLPGQVPPWQASRLALPPGVGFGHPTLLQVHHWLTIQQWLRSWHQPELSISIERAVLDYEVCEKYDGSSLEWLLLCRIDQFHHQRVHMGNVERPCQPSHRKIIFYPCGSIDTDWEFDTVEIGLQSSRTSPGSTNPSSTAVVQDLGYLNQYWWFKLLLLDCLTHQGRIYQVQSPAFSYTSSGGRV